MPARIASWTRPLAALLLAAALALPGCANLAAGNKPSTAPGYGDAQFRPRLFQNLPADMHQPDGMRLNPATGEMFVAFPNFTMKQYPGAIGKITKDNTLVKVCEMPKHPDTGYGCPMGMDFGPDGKLYVCDNQYFYNKDHKSRILRFTFEGDKVVKSEVVVDTIKLANACMFKGNELFFSDTFFDRADKPGMSGVYRVTLDEMNKGPVHLLPKPQAEKDPHFVMEMRTKPIQNRNDTAGADGLTIDSQGNVYCGNFGDGTFYKCSFNPDGTVKSAGVFIYDGSWTCCDGIYYDKTRDCIFATDSEKNAILVIWLPEAKATRLWMNDNADGSDGLLNQPCEPNIRGNQLIISNFNMPFPGLKNNKFTKPYTMSVIDISGLKRP